MRIFYDLAMLFMQAGISLAGLFSSKARMWSEGRKNIFSRMRSCIDGAAPLAWFHAASLGEFEQGRPVIEAFRSKYPDYKILLTFFSPSGYEVRKNYEGADYVFYLPVDTRRNARRFLDAAKPQVAVFIKYEFWANYLHLLKSRGIETVIISSIFRRDSAFFKWYGASYRKLLGCFTRIFVQDEESAELLATIGVTNVTVAGDTRFDRVAAIARQAKTLPVVENFTRNARVFIAGSTWPADEDILVRLINDSPRTKFIIAPHEIDTVRIERLRRAITLDSVRYTQVSEADDLSTAQVLIVDTIGILSSVYRYGHYAYIGGGFGVGIHNILEAATFGLPLAFGPKYQKFREARDLTALSGAVSVSGYDDLKGWFDMLEADSGEYYLASRRCSDYVEQGRGATECIISGIFVK